MKSRFAACVTISLSLISPSLAAPGLGGLVLKVRIEDKGRGSLMNAPREELQKDLDSRFRGEGAELLFPGRDSGEASGADLLLRLEVHSRDLHAGIYFCRLDLEVLVGSCYQKRFRISNQNYRESEALKGLHRQLFEALLADEKFKDCLKSRGRAADRGSARGIFGQAARQLWKGHSALWGGSPPPKIGVLASRPNQRKQFVPAHEAGKRLAEALGQIFDPSQALFIGGDETAGFMRQSGSSPMALVSTLNKGGAWPGLRGLDYLLYGKIQPGPLGFRLDLRLLNAQSGLVAATALGCCEPEEDLPAEPMLENLGFEVIPGR